MVFLEHGCRLRTEDEFRTQSDKEHHLKPSPLINIPGNIVQMFPLEYMHLVCLGVMRKLLNLWKNGTKCPYKLSATQIERVSYLLSESARSFGTDFGRKPRTLTELDRWKATEFRTFLLYVGPVVLRSVLKDDYYNNFLLLHVAVRILCDPVLCNRLNEYASSLITVFVKNFRVLYGDKNMTANAHGLLHMANDCKVFGPLDSYSAFKFESKLGRLKSLLKKSNFPLAQVHRRLTEADMIETEKKLNATAKTGSNGVLIPGVTSPQYKKISVNNFELGTAHGENVCRLKDGSLIKIENLATSIQSGNVVIVGRLFQLKDEFF